jgi:hypothetical protein
MTIKPSVKFVGEQENQKAVAPRSSDLQYLPSIHQILAILGITHQDLEAKTASVSIDGLKYLIGEVLQHINVDEVWYLRRYPDVAAAILGGDMASASTHFRVSGFFEGRVPWEMPFDPKYYIHQYSDLLTVFDASDVGALQRHYETKGYYEGRAGVTWHFTDAERWRTAPRAS